MDESADSVKNVSIDSRDASEALAASDMDSSPWRKRVFVIWATIGALVLLGAVIYLLGVLSMPVSIFLWTLVIVFCLRGIVNKLQSKGLNRVLGTTIAYVIMILVVLGIVFLMFSPMFGLGEQFNNLISGIPAFVQDVKHWYEGIAEQYSDIMSSETFKSTMNSVGSSLSSWASSFASGAANAAVGLGTTVANAVTAIGFAVVIAFWVLLELPAMGRESRRVVSAKYAEQAEFFHVTFTRILGGYIKGTVLQCLIIGVACGIAYAIVGIPNAPALGVITGVLNIIPIVGPWLGGGVTAISAVFASPLKAIIALVCAIVIQQIVYTFISPKIMQNSVDIHPAMTLIAMIVGSAIGGAMSGIVGTIVGMLLAIPAAAVIKSAFIFYFERRTGRQIVSEDGFFFKGTPDPDGTDPLYDATGGSADDEQKVRGAKDRALKEREDTRKKQMEHRGQRNDDSAKLEREAKDLKKEAKERMHEAKEAAKEAKAEAKAHERELQEQSMSELERDAQERKLAAKEAKAEAKEQRVKAKEAKLEAKASKLEAKDRERKLEEQHEFDSQHPE